MFIEWDSLMLGGNDDLNTVIIIIIIICSVLRRIKK